MGIVVITIPGEVKKAFVNELHLRSGVDLVIVQKPRPISSFKRLKELYGAVGFWRFFRELWYAFLIRIRPRTQRALQYFRATTKKNKHEKVLPTVWEVDSVNSAVVVDRLKILRPDIIAVWGSTILKPEVIRTARKTINLHMGYCPHYRGAIANQWAVLQKDFRNIGATIHHIDETVDTGPVIEIIAGRRSLSPREFFTDLNDRAFERFIEIIHSLSKGEKVPSIPQDRRAGIKLFLKKHWTPEARYRVGRIIRHFENEGESFFV